MHRRPSSIRRRITTLILIASLILTAVSALASVLVLLSEFSRLEENLLRDDLQSVVALVQSQSELLLQATRLAALSEGAGAAPPGLPESWLDALRIEVLASVDSSGRVERIRSSGGGPASPAWVAFLEANPLTPEQARSGQTGLVMLDGQVWLAATQPSAEGALIAARRLDEGFFQQIANRVQGGIRLYGFDDPQLPADFAAARENFLQSGQATLQTLPDHSLAAFHVFPGLNGQPALILQLVKPRNGFQQGRWNMAFFALATLATGGLLALILSQQIDRQVTSRLEELYTGIQRIREARDFSLRLHLSGDDELAHLAGGINEAIQALETSTLALHENQERLSYEATHDALTGFPNRLFFTQRLNQALALLEMGRTPQVALLFIDVDAFKLINESYDHPFGDRVLVLFAERLKGCLRADDVLARLGGDEFAVLLENVHEPEEAERVARRILEETRRSFELEGHSLFLTCSIGIATASRLMRGEELLRNADMAMYSAKERGKACYALFDETMHHQAIHRLNLENDLRRAIEREEFVVYYQPIVSMFDGRVTALEALMRWQHPERGLLLPESFLNVAKETGLINALNFILFRQSFRQLRQWRDQGFKDIRLALNISARVLPETSFWALFESELEAAGVPPTAIQIEVVESEMAASIDSTLHALERLQQMGVTISVDDFGTGYSSLAYLKRLPIHSLKIDRTFIKDVINDRDDAAIVSAMIVMAHVLDLDVVAEGVETESQFRFLLDQSCEKAQGYLLAHPQPPETVTQLLHSGKALLPDQD
ncbi:MAG TPA: hypothetical protein DEQ80_01590 [Anaerolinea thermolimosa]|uniref:EAL domain-containing protein n=1 Tax=Anaerolinea thermolimosa TaxID=229919 RepID=A0A3D1JD70_9CHLR|nr:hypothetical protein [Anaerolinea thermolimosa]